MNHPDQTQAAKPSPEDMRVQAMLNALKQQRDATADALVNQLGAYADLEARHAELRAVTQDLRTQTIIAVEFALGALVKATDERLSVTDAILEEAAHKLRALLAQLKPPAEAQPEPAAPVTESSPAGVSP